MADEHHSRGRPAPFPAGSARAPHLDKDSPEQIEAVLGRMSDRIGDALGPARYYLRNLVKEHLEVDLKPGSILYDLLRAEVGLRRWEAGRLTLPQLTGLLRFLHRLRNAATEEERQSILADISECRRQLERLDPERARETGVDELTKALGAFPPPRREAGQAAAVSPGVTSDARDSSGLASNAPGATEGQPRPPDPGKPKRDRGKARLVVGYYIKYVEDRLAGRAQGGPPTVAELARMAGCSTATASRATSDLRAKYEGILRQEGAPRGYKSGGDMDAWHDEEDDD